MSKCRGCGAEIQWIKTDSGKAMPADMQKQTIITASGQVVNGFTSHFATCPQANNFRKGNQP
ncbi:hypothetical protein [Domibacillus tundrae]|uniref:hypothetical protein n=1 Tax=Domibacillus tundrae TaxID=1587527 RepID=UPI000617E0F8|nr:hypothetical protein [Domibacillus tundrae]